MYRGIVNSTANVMWIMGMYTLPVVKSDVNVGYPELVDGSGAPVDTGGLV